jgi:hypothetical protein
MFSAKTCSSGKSSRFKRDMKSLVALVVWLLVPMATFAQLLKDPTIWSASLPKQPVKVGDVVSVSIQAIISGDWHIYSNDLDPNIGPLPTSFKFGSSDAWQRVGEPVPVGVEEKFEEVWNTKIRQFSGKALFIQKLKLLKPNAVFTGTVEYMACSSKDGTCLPPAEVEFSVSIKAGVADVSKPAAVATASVTKDTLAVSGTGGAATASGLTISSNLGRRPAQFYGSNNQEGCCGSPTNVKRSGYGRRWVALGFHRSGFSLGVGGIANALRVSDYSGHSEFFYESAGWAVESGSVWGLYHWYLRTNRYGHITVQRPGFCQLCQHALAAERSIFCGFLYLWVVVSGFVRDCIA